MKKTYILLLIASISLIAMKADKDAYRIYDQKGKKSSYAKLFRQAMDADVVLFGELHNNPICHWLQYELTADMLDEKGESVFLAAEMFEQDEQLILNEYLNGTISTKSFESQARLWPNYKKDYKPLVELAKENNISFVASNVPRRYASIVFNKGFEGLEELDKHAKLFFAPIPIPYDPELPGYQAMLEMGEGTDEHDSENYPKAQAIKDATMAHFILESLDEGKTCIHYNGTYHSNNFEGIVWYLNQYRPGLNIMTIASVEQESTDVLTEENEALADFILVMPASMTKTY